MVTVNPEYVAVRPPVILAWQAGVRVMREDAGTTASERRLRRRTIALTRLLRVHRNTDAIDRNILYVVMSSAAAAERANLQHRTWCSRARCAFVTDDWHNTTGRYDSGMRLVHVGGHHPSRTAASCCANATTAAARTFFCSAHRSKTLAAQYRFLPALLWAKRQLDAQAHRAHAAPSRVGWVALVDDDSFVFPSAMSRLLRGQNSSVPLHLGDFWHDASSGEPQYACGGGGSIFSRGALEHLDLDHCIRTQHADCAQSDWMLGRCARDARVRLEAAFGCTCVPWRAGTERSVREGLRRGSCAFLQFPNSPGAVGGPFKDLVPLLRALKQPPAIVHQLERLV